MSFPRARAARAFGLGLLVAVLVAACGTNPGPTTGPASPAASAPGMGSTVPGASAATAEGRLTAALGSLHAGYSFDTTVTVAGTVATRASGRWIGGASEFEVIAAGVSVTYRSVPPSAWIQQANGTWTKLDGPAPNADPLSALGKPSAIQVASEDASGATLSASYPASALGLDGSDAVQVRIVVAADGTLDVTYTGTTKAGDAAVETRLTPNASQAPITAPSG